MIKKTIQFGIFFASTLLSSCEGEETAGRGLEDLRRFVSQKIEEISIVDRNSKLAEDLFFVRQARASALQPSKITMRLLIFAEKSYQLKIIDIHRQGFNFNSGASFDIRQIARQNGCFAAINGGFFQTDFAPLGQVISQQKSNGVFSSAKLLSGVFSQKNGRHSIVRRGEFSQKSQPDNMLQSGPMLIYRGQKVAGLSAEKQRRRSFLAQFERGWWALGIASECSLSDLAATLQQLDFAPMGRKIPIANAINLDGGSSTALWVGGADALRSPAGGDVFLSSPWSPLSNIIGLEGKPR